MYADFTPAGDELEGDLKYVPVTPCKIVDTRNTTAGSIGDGEERNFHVFGDAATISEQGGDAAGCQSPGGKPLAAIVLVPLSSQAFTVEFVGSNATGIRNLDISGKLYNVEFLYDSSNDLYGFPPEFDFTPPDIERQIIRAAAAVNAALNSESAVQTVGPQESEVYYIGAGFDPVNPSFILAFAGSYDDRTASEWDVARFKDDYGFFGVKSYSAAG